MQSCIDGNPGESLETERLIVPSQMKIGVVVVAWNSGRELSACVGALLEGVPTEVDLMAQISIVIVDNASVDGSLEEVRSKYRERVKLIELSQNEGFAYACNVGANCDNWDYICFLNPDTEFTARSIYLLCGELEKPNRQQIGIVGPQLLDSRGKIAKSCSRFPSLRGIVAGSIKAPAIFGLPPAMVEWDHRETRTVDQVIGAALVIRGELFRRLNGFDERFFVYYEEVDLCLRARQAGYLCLYLTDVKGSHSGGGSSNQIRVKRLFYVWRSRLLYGKKHFSYPARLALYGFNLLVEPIVRILRAIVVGHRSDIRDLIIVWWSVITWLVKSRGGKLLVANRARLK